MYSWKMTILKEFWNSHINSLNNLKFEKFLTKTKINKHSDKSNFFFQDILKNKHHQRWHWLTTKNSNHEKHSASKIENRVNTHSRKLYRHWVVKVTQTSTNYLLACDFDRKLQIIKPDQFIIIKLHLHLLHERKVFFSFVIPYLLTYLLFDIIHKPRIMYTMYAPLITGLIVK